MTTAQLGKWGERYGITAFEAKQLSRRIDRYGKMREHYCNGDPHPHNARPSDKSRNALLWDLDSEASANSLKKYIKRLGFDGIDFGVGLYPALAKGGDTCIMVPDLEEGD